MRFSTIYLPTRPQPDTIVAIFLLKTYSSSAFPGIEEASYEVLSNTEVGKKEEQYLKEGKILIDVGGGIFDHHNKELKTTSSMLVAQALGIERDQSIQKLLAYTERDDFYGKGTVSNDPLDKAFGLSGLIAALNKTYSSDIPFVINTVIPILKAHHQQEINRVKLIPKEVSELKEKGLFAEKEVHQKKNQLKVCFVESDNVQLPGYLRATDGGKYDVVVQRRSTGHVNILTRPLKRPDLRDVAKFVRSHEYSLLKNGDLYKDEERFRLPGKNDDVVNWYFDPATNSLQNGGVNPDQAVATIIPWIEMKDIVKKGLESATI